jgi:hypothetical protein
MSNVAEFIAIRQQIELLAKQITTLVERRAVPQAKTKFDEARDLLAKLTALADNDVQEVVIGRLTRLLGSLEKKVGTLKPKKAAAKKETAS